MTERYGKCRTCAGSGLIPGEVLKATPMYLVRESPDKTYFCSEVRREALACGSCNGTGISGNLEDQREERD